MICQSDLIWNQIRGIDWRIDVWAFDWRCVIEKNNDLSRIFEKSFKSFFWVTKMMNDVIIFFADVFVRCNHLKWKLKWWLRYYIRLFFSCCLFIKSKINWNDDRIIAFALDALILKKKISYIFWKWRLKMRKSVQKRWLTEWKFENAMNLSTAMANNKKYWNDLNEMIKFEIISFVLLIYVFCVLACSLTL